MIFFVRKTFILGRQVWSYDYMKCKCLIQSFSLVYLKIYLKYVLKNSLMFFTNGQMVHQTSINQYAFRWVLNKDIST